MRDRKLSVPLFKKGVISITNHSPIACAALTVSWDLRTMVNSDCQRPESLRLWQILILELKSRYFTGPVQMFVRGIYTIISGRLYFHVIADELETGGAAVRLKL